MEKSMNELTESSAKTYDGLSTHPTTGHGHDVLAWDANPIQESGSTPVPACWAL
jgi:hypothetical protein